MGQYQILKEQARDHAIKWQHNFPQHNYSWGELAEEQEKFQKLAKKYGLIQEFRENGII